MPAPTEGLLVLRPSPVHALPAQVKLVALVAFGLLVVATPAGAWRALAGHGLLLAATAALARVPAALIARRALIEAPFVAFAMLLPFVAAGPRVQVGPLALSQPGLVGGGTLLAKATLGVVGAILLAATTPTREVLAALDRLRLPRALVAIAVFAVRYVAVVAEDLRRMRMARASRGEPPTALARLRSVGATAGTLFVRAYERGERVHQAMLARGYTGRMPGLASPPPSAAQWARAALLPAAALVIILLAGTPAPR